MSTSSCVAFCCMSCHTASTASGITDCSRARHARPTSPAPANSWPWRRRRQNPLRPKSRPLNSCPVLAAAGECASSRPSGAGCSRARRPALPQQPGRRRDPARFIPTPCRRPVASAIDTLRADRRARAVRRADLCRDRRNGQSIASDFGRDRRAILSRCAPAEAQCTPRPPTAAQPKHQIPISRALHTAGSFLGDFPTPDGVRNSSRKRNGSFRAIRSESGRPMGKLDREAEGGASGSGACSRA
jgi:hypothetical protein